MCLPLQSLFHLCKNLFELGGDKFTRCGDVGVYTRCNGRDGWNKYVNEGRSQY